MKNIFSKIIFCLILLFCGISLVNASSKYYNYKWTNNWSNYNGICSGKIEPEADVTYKKFQTLIPSNLILDNYKKDDEIYKSRSDTCYGRYIINDSIETPDGILAIGYTGLGTPVALLLSKSGELKEAYNYEDHFNSHVFLKKIVKEGSDYYVLGNIIGPDGGIAVLKIKSDGRYISSNVIAEKLFFDDNELTVLSYNDNYYIIDSEYKEHSQTGVYHMVRTDKKFSSEGTTVLINEDEEENTLTSTERSLIKNFKVLADREEYLGFVELYNDGFLYSYPVLESTPEFQGFAIEYMKDGEVKWTKKYNGYWIKDAIYINGKVILLGMNMNYAYKSANPVPTMRYLTDGERDDPQFEIIVLDNDGKEIDREPITNYTGTTNFFMAEHIRKVGNGFVITGVNEVPPPPEDEQAPEEGEQMDTPTPLKIVFLEEREYEKSAKILYFQLPYNITTKTDGNGKVESSVYKAEEGSRVTFTITPDDGYVLKKVKVTDSNGNSVTFTDNVFTMPSADVTIEATFTVKNPETGMFLSFIAILVLTALMLSGIVILKVYKQKVYRI